MVVCKNCAYEITRAIDYCPKCRTKLSFADAELRYLADCYRTSLAAKEYEASAEYCRILADAGYADFEREYALMLEAGSIVPRSYDGAMKYFLLSAKKNDAYSAYRYSRLVSRGNDRAGSFWLLYSALLGAPDAYPKAAKLLAKEGNEDSANYFYMLAARHDDVDSVAELASRYYRGIGVPESSEFAKWYMDKLSFPPLYALKLAYKLRGVKPREPEEVIFDREKLLRRLIQEAGKCGFSEAYFTLNKMLAEIDDVDAMTVLGMLLTDGVGCTANVAEAIRIFTEAASRGGRDAYLCLAEIFVSGEHGELSPELAERYFCEAGKLGSSEAYARLGKLYEDGKLFEKDFKKAEMYYRRAANLGDTDSEARANNIIAERDRLFDEARLSAGENPKKSFRAYAIAAAMGHPAAPRRLADCYLRGMGVEADRYSAYYWYKAAAEGGDDKALYPLGLCLIGGVGVNRDYKRGSEILARAARIGISGAKEAYLSVMEAKRKKLAAKLFSRAQRLLYKKRFAEAREAAELSAEQGHARAAYLVGAIFEFGLGTPTDRVRAAEYYDAAYRAGFRDDGVKYKKIILKLIR